MKKYIFALVAFMTLAMGACNTEADAPIITPEISITAGEVGQGSLSFDIVLKDAAEAGYMLVEKSEAQASDFTTNNIVAKAIKLDISQSQSVSVENLKENTEYQVVAYCKAQGNPAAEVSEVITLCTTGVELQFGFFFYDGVDEASGRHRVSFMGSTQPRGGDMEEYIDVTLYMYLLYEPVGDYVTEGTYVPFEEDGSNMNTNLLYKRGTHVLIDGEPNMQGSGWWLVKNGIAETGYTSSLGTHTISCEEVDGKVITTIVGTMQDTEEGKSFNYCYSTDEIMIRVNDFF